MAFSFGFGGDDIEDEDMGVLGGEAAVGEQAMSAGVPDGVKPFKIDVEELVSLALVLSDYIFILMYNLSDSGTDIFQWQIQKLMSSQLNFDVIMANVSNHSHAPSSLQSSSDPSILCQPN